MMKKLSINEFAYPAGPTGIGELNTVSSGADSEGANNNLGALFWKCLRHGTTADAVTNSLTPRGVALSGVDEPWASFSGGVVNVGGHGDEGFLETGAGQSGPFTTGKYMAWWTEDDWGPQMDRLNTGSVVSISIWSCHVGAGADGVELLYRMAKRCGRMVRAGTGFLYSNNQKMWWQDGSVWQLATPTNKPAPIQRPPGGGALMADAILIPVGGEELGVDAVVAVEVTALAPGREAPLATSLSEGEAAQALTTALLSSAPMDMADTVVAGFRTGIIKITFKTGASAIFDVFNDGLAIECETRTGYYLAGRLSRIAPMAGG